MSAGPICGICGHHFVGDPCWRDDCDCPPGCEVRRQRKLDAAGRTSRVVRGSERRVIQSTWLDSTTTMPRTMADNAQRSGTDRRQADQRQGPAERRSEYPSSWTQYPHARLREGRPRRAADRPWEAPLRGKGS
jgi:hypothetical protein